MVNFSPLLAATELTSSKLWCLCQRSVYDFGGFWKHAQLPLFHTCYAGMYCMCGYVFMVCLNECFATAGASDHCTETEMLEGRKGSGKGLMCLLHFHEYMDSGDVIKMHIFHFPIKIFLKVW